MFMGVVVMVYLIVIMIIVLIYGIVEDYKVIVNRKVSFLGDVLLIC